MEEKHLARGPLSGVQLCMNEGRGAWQFYMGGGMAILHGRREPFTPKLP